MDQVTPEGILRSAQGFMESRILLTAAELNLFSALKAAPLSPADLAGRTGCDARALTVLLDALASMGFLVKREQTYACGESAGRLLTDDSPASVLPMLRHMATLWKRWSRLTDIVGDPDGAGDLSGVRWDPEEQLAFIGAMHAVSRPLAERTVASVGADAGAKALLDVGGGSGSYTIAFLEAVPGMQATLFDLPEVIEMARERIQAEGLLGRVRLVPGDYHQDPLPSGNDLALLSAVIHSNSPEQNRSLYRKVFLALDPGGRILIRDHVMDEDRTRPRSGAIFAINMLVGTQGGGTYTYREIEKGLSDAGFTGVRLLRGGEQMDAIVEARKP